MDRSPRGLDGTHLFYIRGEGILEVSRRAVTQGVDVDRELLVQDDLQVAGQLRSQGLGLVGRQAKASQVEILGGPSIVILASRLKEPGYRSARRAAVKVVDRDVRRHWRRLGTRLVSRCLDCLLAIRLPPGRALGKPEQ